MDDEAVLDPIMNSNRVTSGLVSPITLVFAFLDGSDGRAKNGRCEPGQKLSTGRRKEHQRTHLSRPIASLTREVSTFLSRLDLKV